MFYFLFYLFYSERKKMHRCDFFLPDATYIQVIIQKLWCANARLSMQINKYDLLVTVLISFNYHIYYAFYVY